ncbi:hypothetical protein [Rhodanobacter glycinis]|nr:hypothetical protein [Rhodanobacter glycinis]
MTDDELTDQAAADLIRCYVKQNVMAMLIRAALLRAAAKSLDDPASKLLH